MLRSIRSHAKSFVSKIILALLIASFAVWGIEDMLVARPGQEEAARVGKVVISRLAVEREMQRDIAKMRERLGGEFKQEFVQMLKIPQQATQRMVAQELIRQETKALGLIPSDGMVAEVLRNDTMFQNDDGVFDKKLFLRILRQNGLAERDFVTMMRDDISRRLLSQVVSGNFGVQDMAVKVMQAAANETRNVSLYRITPKNPTIDEPTDQEMEAYYKSVANRYAIPEYRAISYTTIDEGDVADEVTVSSEELKQLYDERIEEFKIGETRDIELLLYTGKDNAIKAGEMFKAGKSSTHIAKKLPPVNAANTQMKAVNQAALPEELQQAVFALQAGDVSEPIASGFGFHTVKVAAVHPATTKSFAEVEDSLRSELTTNRATELLTQKADGLEDLLAGGATLNEAAKELALKVNTVESVSKVGSNPAGKTVTLPDLKNFVPLAFSTTEGEASSISLGKPGVYYLLQVDKVIPQVLPPIAEVRTELVKSWKDSRRDTMEMKHASEVAAKLADPKQREAVLASTDIKKLTTGNIGREDLKLRSVELPAEIVQSIFANDMDSVTRISQLSSGRYAVAIIHSSTMPELKTELDEEATELRTSMQTNQQQELMQQLMQHLYEKYDAQVHQDVIGLIGKDDG